MSSDFPLVPGWVYYAARNSRKKRGVQGFFDVLCVYYEVIQVKVIVDRKMTKEYAEYSATTSPATVTIRTEKTTESTLFHEFFHHLFRMKRGYGSAGSGEVAIHDRGSSEESLAEGWAISTMRKLGKDPV